ncbi:DUF29 domain-containing protein [Leptothoe spongobia]|uniref:DUF29 family protein n=1 Tax=Leptothoe spongobia TAU-MAC 1115 TaxID=1967444 RepID=A0A947DH75_9CYAN|nr:DUF29 domain-containing protein [Leptothoe spongobia]MBT9316831.1 DUF29 family protein [Leptothoe spongobia TAU-MAC 1115]
MPSPTNQAPATEHASTPVTVASTSRGALYDNDFMAWCEYQAEALRSQDFGNLDLANLIEEISDMGREQFNKTASLTRQIIIHILKLQAFPNDQATEHWRDEIEAFQDNLDDIISGSIRYRFQQQETFAAQQAKALRRLQRKYPDTKFQALEAMSLDEIINWPDSN